MTHMTLSQAARFQVRSAAPVRKDVAQVPGAITPARVRCPCWTPVQLRSERGVIGLVCVHCQTTEVR